MNQYRNIWIALMSRTSRKIRREMIFTPNIPTLLPQKVYGGGPKNNTCHRKRPHGKCDKRMLYEIVSRCIFPNSRWNDALPVLTDVLNKGYNDLGRNALTSSQLP